MIRDYLSGRRDPIYDAVKYRSKVACAVRHAHLKRDGEFGRFLFTKSGEAYETPLFERYRQAHYSRAAIFELPYTVAEGFAAKHGISRKVFLEKIEPRLTRGERLRLQRARREQGKSTTSIQRRSV